MAALEQQRCGICELELDEPRTLRCGHSFCGDCLEMRRHKLRDECWWCPACGERTGELFGASNDVDNRLGETRLHALATRAPGGVLATFERCVAAGLAVDGRRADGATPLFLAAYLGHVAEVVELLRLRADPNARAWGWGWPESFGFFAADDAERARRRNALAAPGGLTPLGIAVAQGRPGASDGAVTALLLCGARRAADDDCDEEDAGVGAFLAEDAREALRDDAAAVAVLGFDPRGPARVEAQHGDRRRVVAKRLPRVLREERADAGVLLVAVVVGRAARAAQEQRGHRAVARPRPPLRHGDAQGREAARRRQRVPSPRALRVVRREEPKGLGPPPAPGSRVRIRAEPQQLDDLGDVAEVGREEEGRRAVGAAAVDGEPRGDAAFERREDAAGRAGRERVEPRLAEPVVDVV